MTYQQALSLLNSFPKKPTDDWDEHCINVGEIAYRIALALSKYIAIDPEEVRLMGLAHDFGRSVTQCPYGHIYEGFKLFKRMGEDKLARICACHSNGTYREADIEGLGLAPQDFFVATMEEKMVFMADNLDCHGKTVRQSDRLSETIERYRKVDPSMLPILEKKFSEFSQFDKEIQGITGKNAYQILGI